MDRVLFKKLYFGVVLGVFVLVGGMVVTEKASAQSMYSNAPAVNPYTQQPTDGPNNGTSLYKDVPAGVTNIYNPAANPNLGADWTAGVSYTDANGNTRNVAVDTKPDTSNSGDNFGCEFNVTDSSKSANPFSTQCITNALYYLILSPVAFLMGVCGIIFDLSIEFSILKISSFVNDNSGSIYLAWSTLRDVCNLLFIGVLLYAAIDTILGGGNAKKIIIGVVTAALLINFSLFFTKVLVDASNIVSLQFYNAASGGSNMSWQIMQLTKNVTLYNPSKTPSTNSGPNQQTLQASYGGPGQLIVGIIMSALFMLITSFVFLVGAILFAIRYAILLILLATSPIAYVSGTLPKLEGMIGKTWWESLWNQLIFSPVYMFMMWLSIKVLQQMSDAATSKTPGNLAGDQNLIINFVIVITFMLASVIIAKKLGASGASWAQGIAGGATIGGAAWVGRNTFGKYANTITNSEAFKGFAASNPLGLGQLSKKGLDRVSSSTFDVRKPLKNVTGVDIGSTKSKGYIEDKKKSDKETAEFAQFVGKGEGGEARIGTFLSGQYGPRTIQNQVASFTNKVVDKTLGVVGGKNVRGSIFGSFNEKLAKEDSELTKKVQEEWDKKNIDKLKKLIEEEKGKGNTQKPEALVAAEAKLSSLTSGSREHAETEEKIKEIKTQLKYIEPTDNNENQKIKELQERIDKAEKKKKKDEEKELVKEISEEIEKEKKKDDGGNDKEKKDDSKK